MANKADDDGYLCTQAKDKYAQGDPFGAIHTYAQVIRHQVNEGDILRETSRSREALCGIFHILQETFGISQPSYRVKGWWLTDVLFLGSTLHPAITKVQWPLDSHTEELFLTLADYILKWYSGTESSIAASECAGSLYHWILVSKDNNRSSEPQTEKEARIVKELSKLYVEHPGKHNGVSWSDRHAIILRGFAEINRRMDFETLRFQQRLGALYLNDSGTNLETKEQDGELILRATYELQKRIFGLVNRHTIKTVKILSRFYMKHPERHIEGAALIEDTIRRLLAEGDKTSISESEEADAENHDGDPGDDGEFTVEADSIGRQRELEEWERDISLTNTSATTDDHVFESIYKADSLQARVMLLCTPVSDMCWEDSRVYFKDIVQIQFQPTLVPDPFARHPVMVVLSGKRLDVLVPGWCHSLIGNEKELSESVSIVQRSQFLGLLKSRIELDRRVLSLNESGRWEMTDSHTSRPMENYPKRNNRAGTYSRSNNFHRTELQEPVPDLVSQHCDLTFWIFPEELAKLEESYSGYRYPESTKPRCNGAGRIYELRKLSDPCAFLVIIVDGGKGMQSRRRSFRSISSEDEEHVGAISWIHTAPTAFTFSINEYDRSSISVVCPYVTFSDFQQSRALKLGFTYADYMLLFHLLQRGDNYSRKLWHIKEGICKDQVAKTRKLPKMIFEPETSINDETFGFFNYVPGDCALIDFSNSACGFNLVSSQWVDWKRFPVHQEVPDLSPQLRSRDGDIINCRGYIAGRWIPQDMAGLWFVDKVFVVDAIFATKRQPLELQNFIFSACTLKDELKRELISAEKRLLLGKLNPTLFRPVKLGKRRGRAFLNKKKIKAPPSPKIDDYIMDESRRRDECDRQYEVNRKKFENDTEILKRLEMDHNKELLRRQEWDNTERKLLSRGILPNLELKE